MVGVAGRLRRRSSAAQVITGDGFVKSHQSAQRVHHAAPGFAGLVTYRGELCVVSCVYAAGPVCIGAARRRLRAKVAELFRRFDSFNSRVT